ARGHVRESLRPGEGAQEGTGRRGLKAVPDQTYVGPASVGVEGLPPQPGVFRQPEESTRRQTAFKLFKLAAIEVPVRQPSPCAKKRLAFHNRLLVFGGIGTCSCDSGRPVP